MQAQPNVIVSDRPANPRPQRLHTWLNLIPVAEYEANRPLKILFLDTFVVIQGSDKPDSPYTILFEGKHRMQYVIYVGIIFVWYGQDLNKPDRPFPKLYDSLYPTQYISSKPVIFENTHVMDFVENGSDNLHFRHVHLWEYSKIYNHKITAHTITLEQDARMNYGRCSFNPFIRFMSYLLPKLELHHNYAYHGPTIAIVNATGKGSPESHSMVTLTPEGPNRTRVYVTMAMPETTFPAFMEKTYQWITRGKKLCDVLTGVMANYIKNEFDVDAVIWKDRRVKQPYNLLAAEQHLQGVVDWGKTFYPPEFTPPPVPAPKAESEKQWQLLAPVSNIKVGEISSFTVAGEALIAFKASTGEVHVKEAYCPHQGAHLGVQGRIEDDCIRCPFHGFYFDFEGQCRGSNIKNTTQPISQLKLPSIQHRIVNQQVEVFV